MQSQKKLKDKHESRLKAVYTLQTHLYKYNSIEKDHLKLTN